jgi:hypothetical protein
MRASANLAAESHSRPSYSLLHSRCPCCAWRTCGCVREPSFFPPIRAGGNSTTTQHSAAAVGFGLLNLAYVAGAFLAILRGNVHQRESGIRWAGLLVGFLLLRSAFLGSVESPEPRYTLECYPAIIVLASGWLAGLGKKSATVN